MRCPYQSREEDRADRCLYISSNIRKEYRKQNIRKTRDTHT